MTRDLSYPEEHSYDWSRSNDSFFMNSYFDGYDQARRYTFERDGLCDRDERRFFCDSFEGYGRRFDSFGQGVVEGMELRGGGCLRHCDQSLGESVVMEALAGKQRRFAYPRDGCSRSDGFRYGDGRYFDSCLCEDLSESETDPSLLTVFPGEMIYHILSYLDQQSVLSTLANVCKSWRSSLSYYLKSLSLTKTMKPFTFRQFATLRHFTSLTSLKIDNIDLILDDYYESITHTYGWLFENKTAHTNIVTRWMLFVISKLTNLEELVIKLPALDSFGAKCIRKLENIKKLELEGGFYLKEEDYMILTENKKLEYLDLKSSMCVTDRVIAHLASNNKELKYLNLSGSSITINSLSYISQLENLEELHITKCPYFYQVELVRNYFKNMNKIRVLSLTDSFLTDESLAVFHTLQNLDTLVLEEGNFSEEGLKGILERNQKISNLDISGSEISFINSDLNQLKIFMRLKKLELNPSFLSTKKIIELAWLLGDILVHDSRLECLSVSPLISATCFGYLDSVQLFYSEGCVMEERDEKNKTPLMVAVENGHQPLVNFFLSHGSDLEATDNEGNTCALLACRYGNLDILNSLISHGADLTKRNDNNENCFLNASISGSVELMEYLVEYCDKELFTEVDVHGTSALLCASMFGNLDMVKWLINHGSNVDEKNDYGCTALLLAVINNHHDIVDYLLDMGANINEQNDQHESAVLCASNEGHLTLLHFLISKGADYLTKDNQGCSPLHLACMNGHLKIAKYLSSLGLKLEEKNNYGCTPLLLASINGHLNIVKWLVSKKVMIDEKNNDGETSLLCSASQGHLKIVSFLIMNGACINERNNYGETVLCCAIQGGYTEVVKLLSAYYHPHPRDWENGLLIASMCGHLEIIKILYDLGTSIRVKTSNGRTPLHLAAIHGHFNVISWLYSHGCNLLDRDDEGFSALTLSLQYKHIEISKWIAEKTKEDILRNFNSKRFEELKAQYSNEFSEDLQESWYGNI
eukprot:TRINITY_DN2771_c0_g1_i1.p1 TRINITY_DN2771_c0_g1~~TRINITY_DN2771_c0_g1_i1.p1  ORF type:complete len:986 (-),score=182.87 TRINITY_DN2771_c0_g1_i1:41-2998(-)